MPELPDVEVYKRYFDSTALHNVIDDVDVRSPLLLDDTSPSALQQGLRGTAVEETRRHGKHLFARLGTGQWLALHFGMSGRLVYYEHNGPKSEYEYVRIHFENGYCLALVMPRKLGRVRLIDDPYAFIADQHLGPDALLLQASTFSAQLEGRRGMIKSALMDQTVIAGLGNVYSDEVLFQAGLHPRTRVHDLTEADHQALFEALQDVLITAIRCKADPDQMPTDRFLLAHRQSDRIDPYSGTALEKIRVSGRTGYYSPARQPAR